jgi:hypothetical protein
MRIGVTNRFPSANYSDSGFIIGNSMISRT